MRLKVALVMLPLAFCLGCSGPATDLQQTAAPRPEAGSPEAVTLEFLQLAAAGDKSAATALIWRPDRQNPPVPSPSDDLRGITDIEVHGPSREDSARGRPEELSDLESLRGLSVEFTTHATSEIGEPPGRYLRFVTVGRDTADGPWLIVEIGTGP